MHEAEITLWEYVGQFKYSRTRKNEVVAKEVSLEAHDFISIFNQFHIIRLDLGLIRI